MTSPPVSNRRARTRDRLLDAAISLFAEKGILAASVEEICERADFTRGAFYSNFASKDELLIAVLQRKGLQIERAAATAAASAAAGADQLAKDSPVDLVGQAMTVFQSSIAVDSEWLLARNEIRLYALRNPDVRPLFDQIESRLDELMVSSLDTLAKYVGASLLVPASHLVVIFKGYYEMLAMGTLLMGGSLDEIDFADRLSTLFRAVLAASVGSPHEHPPH